MLTSNLFTHPCFFFSCLLPLFFLTHVPQFCPLLHPVISSSLNTLKILHDTKILFFLDLIINLIHTHNLPLVCVGFWLQFIPLMPLGGFYTRDNWFPLILWVASLALSVSLIPAPINAFFLILTRLNVVAFQLHNLSMSKKYLIKT